MRLGPVHDSWLKHVDSYSTGMVVLTVSLYPLSILSSPSSLLILHAPREKKKKEADFSFWSPSNKLDWAKVQSIWTFQLDRR